MNHDRIWVDGCFDFFHHGHAGALHQARTLGQELIVGIHSDEEILANKGPVVMHLKERDFAVKSCRWTSETVTNAPYVTDSKVMDEYNCWYVAHGDDITTDAQGNDCYASVKKANRFLEFKRTPNISTTDLIGRMLSQTLTHHLEADSSDLKTADSLERFKMYATAENARDEWCAVYNNNSRIVEPSPKLVSLLKSGGVYVQDSFDLFHCGHMELLRQLKEKYGVVVVGVRSDKSVNQELGSNWPLMNVFERGLCVLQCKYIDAVILNSDVNNFDFKQISSSLEQVEPCYKGDYEYLTANSIVDRVLANRLAYEERQRKKGFKSTLEKELKDKD